MSPRYRVTLTEEERKESNKNEYKPHLRKYRKIQFQGSSAFVAAMEDVLEVYHLPYDPDYPVVGMDEFCK